jgi:hypothetical protein
MSATLNLLIMSNSVIQNFAINYTYAASSQESAALWELNQLRNVNGALLYRILSENQSMIDLSNGSNFAIRDFKADGTPGGAINTLVSLKEKANKEYKVTVSRLANGMIKVVGDEVKV